MSKPPTLLSPYQQLATGDGGQSLRLGMISNQKVSLVKREKSHVTLL